MKELRFGTQGQRHKGKTRISPLFERFLFIQAEREPDKSKITHIYFNNLGLDRPDPGDFEGKKESELSQALHTLEVTHPNIAVITLPADKDLMRKEGYKNTKPGFAAREAYTEFLQIATEDPALQREIKDFKISPAIRQKLFTNKRGIYSYETEEKILGRLLTKSFQAMGIDEDDTISEAQRQSVWFHFNKFALPNFIIEKLDPYYVNFSCKDAIDRGGVSSAYYNLLKSFEPDSRYPLTREEFDRGLHAAPAMVKGRGMNHHINVIWNAVNNYVNRYYFQLQKDPDKAWLIEWRDYNCPHASVGELLKLRLEQSLNELETLEVEFEFSPDKSKYIKTGIQILHEIKNQSESEVSGKRLLLETVILTPKIALNGTYEDIARYTNLQKKLSFNPVLMVLGGLMESFIGLIISVLSFGQATGLFKSGLATLKAGCEFSVRQALCAGMQQQIDDTRELIIEDRFRIF